MEESSILGADVLLGDLLVSDWAYISIYGPVRKTLADQEGNTNTKRTTPCQRMAYSMAIICCSDSIYYCINNLDVCSAPIMDDIR